MTEKYRYYLSIGDSKNAKAVKDSSEFITASVICSGGRTLKHVTAYTSVLMGDVDKLPEGVAARLIALLKDDPHVLLAHETLSGGVHLFFPVDTADRSQHAAAYSQGMAHFEQLLGYPLDGQCKNLTRTANLCYAPHAFYNPDAVPLPVYVADKQPDNTGHPRKKHHATIYKAAPVILSMLAKQEKTYKQGHHNEFVSCAVYLMNAFGVTSQEVTDWVRSGYPDFDATELEGIVRSVYEQHAGEHGTKALPKEKSGYVEYASIDDLETFITTQAEIRHNIILDRREILWKGRETEFRDMSDKDENTLWLRAKKNGLNSPQNTFLCLFRSEFIPEFNPLTDYFENCPPWDGVTDYIGQVASMVHTANDAEFHTAFRKWFVGIAASVYNNESVNQTILTLIGEQGIYKTSFFSRLLPKELRRYFYTKINTGALTKDDRIALAEMLVMCYEEVDEMNHAENNQLKAVLSMENTNERAPYARNKDFRPHIASFCATGNNPHFLIDDTGNRRWRIFRVSDIDNPYLNPIPHEGMYAQALALYRSGFRHWYNKQETKLLNLQNKEFEQPNIEEELILSRFRVPRPAEDGKFMSTAEIMEFIGANIKYNLSKNRIYRAMEKIGFRHKRTGNCRGFLVMQLNAEEIALRKEMR